MTDRENTGAAPAAGQTRGNGAGGEAAGEAQMAPDAAALGKIAPQVGKLRAHVRESFGKIVMTMMLLPRYRNQTLADLQHLVLDPLVRDRIALAYAGDKEQPALADLAGLAIWASVSEEVDARIREQVKTGTFPVRPQGLKTELGPINWLFDVVAPNSKMAASVLVNFGRVVKGGDLRLHPMIARLVDEETLQKLGARKMEGSASHRCRSRIRRSNVIRLTRAIRPGCDFKAERSAGRWSGSPVGTRV
ncbi:MAG: toxin-activating lysine-acyltransferase [Hyphomicrobiales bacterium]